MNLKVLVMIGISILYGGQSMNTQDPLKDERSCYINEIPSYKESDWNSVSSLDRFGGISFESHSWHTMILHQRAIPEDDSPNTVISFRPGNEAIEQIDLLRFKYKYKQMNVTLYESGSILYTQVENFTNLLDNKTDLKKKIMIVSSVLFQIKTPIEFKQLSQEGKFALFSTNPEYTLVKIEDWSDRIDCIANENQMVFMIFKVSLEGNKIFPKNPYNWFPEEMRIFKH